VKKLWRTSKRNGRVSAILEAECFLETTWTFLAENIVGHELFISIVLYYN